MSENSKIELCAVCVTQDVCRDRGECVQKDAWPANEELTGTYEVPFLERKYKCSKCGYPLGNDDGLCMDCANSAESGEPAK